MGARFRPWWQKIKRHPFIVAGIIVVIFALTTFSIGVIKFGWDWTGFRGGESKVTTTMITPGTTVATEQQPTKTLWDWLGLIGVLAIPIVVGLGAAWYTAQQRKVSERETRDNQRHATLQAYLDKMSELLLNGNLAERTEDGQLNPEYKRGCLVARVRTITVLTQLDARRIGYVFAFLREAELMSVTKDDNVISLKNADLHAVDWSQADLRGADLRGADLSRANLSGANLSEANLNGAYLSEANLSEAYLFISDLIGTHLSGADLSGADLTGADLSDANLKGVIGITIEELKKQAKELQGATMPDGSKHQ